MIKLLSIIILSLFLASPGWGATFYVTPTGTRTTGASTVGDWSNANCYGDPGVMAGQASFTVGPHNVYIAPGTYANGMTLQTTQWNNSTITGVAAVGSTTPATWSQILAGNGAKITNTGGNNPLVYLFYNGTISGLTVQGLELEGHQNNKAIFVRYATHTATFKNIWAHGQFTNIVDNAGVATIEKSKLTKSGTTYTANPILLESGSTTNLQYNIIGNEVTGDITDTSVAMINNAGGTVNIYNNGIYGGRTHLINTSSGTTNINNNILGPIKSLSTNIYLIYKAGGTVNATNNLMIPHIVNMHAYANTTLDTDTGNITGQQPKYTHRLKSGIISLDTDDVSDAAYTLSLVPYFQARGVRGTYFIETGRYANDPTNIQAVFSSGTFDIASHTTSHFDLTYTHGLNFSQTGGTNCTIAFDATTKVFTGECDSTTYDFTYDATGKNFAEIIAAINGNGAGWTAAYSTTGGQVSAHFSPISSVNTLATRTATAEPADVDFDRTGITQGVFYEEFVVSKEFMETTFPGNAGNVVGGAPFNTVDSTILTNAALAFDAYRVGYNGAGAQQDLASISPYGLACYGVFMFVSHAPNHVASSVADNGAGLIRVTNTSHYLVNGEQVVVEGVTGTGAADINGTWTVSGVTADTFDLEGTTYNAGHTYTLTNAAFHSTDDAVRGRTRVLCEYAAQFGYWFTLLAHNYQELTPHQWGVMIDTIKEYPDIQIMTVAAATDYIKNSGLWTGTGPYTRTWTDAADSRLLSSSRCINAGTDVSLTTDFIGNAIQGYPDIGAYEYRRSLGIGYFGSGGGSPFFGFFP